MDRRRALKNLAIASGGMITLPQWMVSCGVSDTNTYLSSFTSSEQNILASIADTIIPAGNSIGALSVGVDKFLQKLIDDCYEKEIQDNIKSQLKKIDDDARIAYKKSFTDCAQQEREELLRKFSTSSAKEEKEFFDLVKSETIRGFNTSQKVMKEYLGYQVAPGHFYGCVDVKTNDHA